MDKNGINHAKGNFFDMNFENTVEDNAPLAVRMRLRTLDDFVGQQQIIGKGKLLYRLIMADKLSSVVFYGPPGTGKTTLAQINRQAYQGSLFELNAVTSGKKEIVEVLDKAKDNLGMYGRKTILFIDEIHRFNKAQQDVAAAQCGAGTGHPNWGHHRESLF